MIHNKVDNTPIILHPSPPYDFSITVEAARFNSILGWRHGSAYRRTLRVGKGLSLIEISEVGMPQAPQLQVRLLASQGVIDQDALQRRLAHMLNLHVDFNPFYEFAQTDPVLWKIVRRVYGLRSFAADSMFEALILCVIEQQISLRMAHAAERWLISWAGEGIDYEGETYYAFPTPDYLAALTVDDLKPLKITFQRMARILEIAQGIAQGSLDLEGLRGLPPSEAYAALRRLKGVGHWTAVWAMIQGFGHYANFGSSDVALRAAVNHYFYGAAGKATCEVVDRLLAGSHPFDGMVAFHTIMRWALERYQDL
jgi:DNA-3-methyladenine glycosylase II